MTVKLPSLPSVVLVAAALLGLALWNRFQQREGMLKAAIRTLAAQNDTLRHQGDSLARQHKTDTLRLVVTRRHADSLLITDTVIHTDTVRQIVAAERRACDALVATCEAEKANLHSQIGNVEAQRDAWQKRARGFRLLGIPVGCAAGLAGTQRSVGVGAACGVRF